jgi:hypothetical protein
MNEMIYYPGFEVRDENWLKFALLYFDTLRPIIPDFPRDIDSYLSDAGLSVMHNTDLIDPYWPRYDEGVCASVLACEKFDEYLRSPKQYAGLFNYGYGHNITEKWRDKRYQTCTLFSGKYSIAFYEYCRDNHIASPCDVGILVSEELAFAYMSFLADIISKNNELEMITDVQKYARFLLANDQKLAKATQTNFDVAQHSIELNIPSNLSSIPLEKFIDLRNQKDFNECRKAYVNEIGRLIEARERRKSDYSLERLLSHKKDFIKICELTINMISSVTISINSIRQLLVGGEGSVPLTLATAYTDCRAVRDIVCGVPQLVDELRDKHFARKYLAKLGKLRVV